jgi:hypothetical protein
VIYRINAGGPSWGDSEGNFWQEDTLFYEGGTAASTSQPIFSTTRSTLYQSERWGAMTYSLPIPNGSYHVRLHFAETSAVNFGIGNRLFNVLLEGQPVLTDFDIFAKVGALTADIEQFDITVNDGMLNIEFVQVMDEPTISGIEVEELTAPMAGPAKVFGVSRTGYAATLLEPGQPLYVDSPLSVAEPVSPLLRGQTFIQTLNREGSQTSSTTSYLSFRIDRPSTVYVALDRRNTPVPAWLASWKPSDAAFSLSDGSQGRVLFSKPFPAGPVTLGANREAGSPLGVGMYSVIIVPKYAPPSAVRGWARYASW